MIKIRPQPGPQEQFLSSSADIVIYGGAAGGGKTYGLLLEPLRHINNPKFGGVIFRRESTQIETEGGLLDESKNIYSLLGANIKTSPFIQWKFPKNSKMQFRHLQHEKHLFSWQGSQIPFIGFDELTHFLRRQFFYMLSRNRSTCGVRPYVRATCNPDPDSFVADLVAWWINQETGYPILERSGVIRYFVVYKDELEWSDDPGKLKKKYPDMDPKSLTFIPSTIHDNKILMEKDPGYAANLDALGTVDRERLKYGNWKIKPSAGLFFNRGMFEVIAPNSLPIKRNIIRAWDLAATEQTPQNDPDATAGIRMSMDAEKTIYVENLVHLRGSPGKVKKTVMNVASQDGKTVLIRLPQDPGQAGKDQAHDYRKRLIGYKFKIKPVSGDKVTRASSFSAQCEHGAVKVVAGDWNDKFFNELEGFPDGAHDDIVDACSDGFNELSSKQEVHIC